MASLVGPSSLFVVLFWEEEEEKEEEEEADEEDMHIMEEYTSLSAAILMSLPFPFSLLLVGFTGYAAPRVMFPSGVAKPRMLVILPIWTRRTVVVACSRLVSLVVLHLALFPFPLFEGPCCSASWPVWTRMTVTVACTRLVMLVAMHFALCPFPWLTGLECSAFWPVWTRRTVARGVQAIGYSGR